MLENEFKQKLTKEIKSKYPECFVLHLDPTEVQGIPDILVLYKDKWATLEGKKDKDAPFRPNQPYYIDKMNKMSFSSVIFPENKDDVLEQMDGFFNSKRRKK